MKRDEKDEQAIKDQLAAEQAGLTKGSTPKGATQPGETNPEDLPDAMPGAPTPSMPRGAVPLPDPNAPKPRPINLPVEEGQQALLAPAGPSTLGQPTHVQATPREQRGEHQPPMKRRE